MIVPASHDISPFIMSIAIPLATDPSALVTMVAARCAARLRGPVLDPCVQVRHGAVAVQCCDAGDLVNQHAYAMQHGYKQVGPDHADNGLDGLCPSPPPHSGRGAKGDV